MVRLLRSVHAGSALLALLAVLCCAAPAFSDVKLDLSAGFDNNYRPSSWTPLFVRISNAPSNSSGQLQVVVRTRSGTQTYTQPVRLRGGTGSQLFTTYYFHPDAGESPEITVQLVSDGRTIGERKLDNALAIPEGEPAVLALTQDQSGLNFLTSIDTNYDHPSAQTRNYQNQYGANQRFQNGVNNGHTTKTRVLYPRSDSLPDNANGYASVDAVMLGDLPLDLLSEDQWNAIVTWVKDGGILVVSGGADVNRLRSKQLADILPMSINGSTQVTQFPGLAYQYGVAPKTKPAPVATGKLKSDALPLCQQSGLPLVVERQVGHGLVVFTTFDVMAPEFRAWSGQAALWREVMQRGGNSVSIVNTVRGSNETSMNQFGQYGRSNDMLADALAGVQSTEAPSFTMIGIFLLLYIVILVPGNYLLLRKWDKKEMAWITIPVIILFFSVGAYAIGYKIKGGQLYTHFCSVLEGSANTDGWNAYTVASVFSPRQAKYDLSVADPAALVSEVTEGSSGMQRPTSDLLIERENKTTVKNALVNMWDHRSFDFLSHISLGGSVSVSVQTMDAKSCRINVINGTRYTLNDCSVSYKGAQAIAGVLKPGDSKTLKLALDGNNPAVGISVVSTAEGTTPATLKIKEALAALASSSLGADPNGVNRSPLAFTGWFSEPVVGLSLENETPQLTGVNLLVVHLPRPEGQGTAPSPVSYNPPPARQDPFAGNRVGQPTVVMTAPGRTSAAQIMNIPEPANTYNTQAYTYANQGNLDAALKAAEQALNAAPTNGYVLDSVAEMHQKRKEYDKAATYYVKALHVQPAPGLTETHEKYGETLIALGKKQDGIKQLRVAAADTSDRYAGIALSKLSQLGISVGDSTAITSGNSPLIKLSAGQPIPPIPGTGNGSRRILQPVGNSGGYYLITQQWTHSGGSVGSSSSTTFIAPGQPVPQ